MQCPRCQHENPPRAKFCEECATPLARICANCGTQLSPTAKFCPECAHPVAAGMTSQPRFGSPESYTPKHLAEKILTSKTALEGERKQVTVLFADLKGSMELLADRDPEEARKLLDPVLERMMEAVHHYEGTVNQVMGDGIMALFGAPVAHEDHAVRACYAALRMQESVNRYAEELRRSGAAPIQIRVGVNSGEVVVRSIGSDLHMDYTAVGQTTHLAARMEQIATAGSALITGETLKLAEGYVQVRPLGAVPVKGLEAPVEAYELAGTGPVRTRFQATAARGLTRFCGRQAEMDALNRALERAGAGHGEVVALVGEPGVGKSRLVWEFSHSHRTARWLVLETGSVSYGKATAYRPIIDLLRAYCDVEDRDDERRIREKLTGKLLILDKTLEPTLPAFLTLLDVPVDDPEWQALDPPQRRQRTLEACKRLVLRESQLQPLALVFEDLHRIDTETQAFLDSLVESLPTARILLLVNYRPEYQQAWTHKTYYTQLRIDALPPESADQLLRGLVGEDPALRGFRRFLIERTEGNPFFLEESVQALVETHVLLGEPGVYRLAAPLTEIQVPATVQAVLAARIDRLSPEEKRLLQTAAVIGKDVPFVLLQSIAELAPEELRHHLSHLQHAEFLYETTLFPDLEYTFKHALTHDVAYASLLRERRRVLHKKIVDAIERLYPDHLAEHVERLAHHAYRSEAWDKALRYLREAGTKAFDRSANREAVACFEQALAAVKRLPQSRETVEQSIDLLCFHLRKPLVALGDYEATGRHLREAETLTTRLGDQRRLGWISAYLASSSSMTTSDHTRAIESGRRALAIAHDLDDFALHIGARFFLSIPCHAVGKYRQAANHLRWVVNSIPGDRLAEGFGLNAPASVMARAWLAWCLAELGEFSEGIVRGEEAVRAAEGSQLWSLAWSSITLGTVYLRKGDLHRAAAILQRGLSVCETAHFGAAAILAGAQLGYVHALSGRFAEGLRFLEGAVSSELAQLRPLQIAYLSEATLLAGRADAAQLAERALTLSGERNERGHQAWALRTLGEIASGRDPADVEKGEKSYRGAMALAEDLGMRPLVAHCHLGLGKLYGRTGRREQAHEHLTTATTMYREMDMRFWLEKAESASQGAL